MSSPFITIAAIAGSLFVVVLIVVTFVQPYLQTVQTAFTSIGR